MSYGIPCEAANWCTNGSTYMTWLGSGLCTYVGVADNNKFAQLPYETQQQALDWAASYTQLFTLYEGGRLISTGILVFFLAVVYMASLDKDPSVQKKYGNKQTVAKKPSSPQATYEEKTLTASLNNSNVTSPPTKDSSCPIRPIMCGLWGACAGVTLTVLGSSILGSCQ